jgi:hypothetical protein
MSSMLIFFPLFGNYSTFDGYADNYFVMDRMYSKETVLSYPYWKKYPNFFMLYSMVWEIM